MKQLDRYLTGSFLRLYLLSTLSFVVIGLITGVPDFTEYLGRGYSLKESLVLFFWKTPSVYVDLAPIILLLTGLVLLGLMGKTRETLVVESSGISPFRFLLPLFLLSIPVTGMVFTVNETLVPLSVAAISPGETINRPVLALPHFFLFAEEYQPQNHLFVKPDILIFYPGGKLSEIYQARQVAIPEHNRWELTEGEKIIFSIDGRILHQESFNRLVLYPGLTRESILPALKPLNVIPVRQLRAYLKVLHQADLSPPAIETAYRARFAYPLLNVVVLTLALPMLFIRRLHRFLLFSLCLLSAPFTYWLFSLTLAMGTQGYLPSLPAVFLVHALLVLAVLSTWLRLLPAQLFAGRRSSSV